MASFLDLPDDVLLAVLSYLDITDIGRTAQACKQLSHLIGQDAVWQPISRNLVNVRGGEDDARRHNYHYKTGHKIVSLKDKCRISRNWAKGRKKDILLFRFKTRYNPWLQLDGEHLYLSQGEMVQCFRLSDHGRPYKQPRLSFTSQLGDVSHFVVKNGQLLTGGSDGKVLLYNKLTGALLGCYQSSHQSTTVINFTSVDLTDDVILGGLNDDCINLWDMHSGECVTSIPVQDRVWSLSASPCQRSFASGNAGTADDHQPIKIWDIENGKHTLSVGRNWRHGAGILDMQYESPNTLLSCGYDTIVRIWDLRTQCLSPVIELEDPHDYTVYCLQSDGKHLIASGTAVWSVARLWDKRMNRTLRSFFMERSNNPVYSLQFNGSHMYVALGTSLRVLSFTGS